MWNLANYFLRLVCGIHLPQLVGFQGCELDSEKIA